MKKSVFLTLLLTSCSTTSGVSSVDEVSSISAPSSKPSSSVKVSSTKEELDEDKSCEVIVLAGQSNCEGYSYSRELIGNLDKEIIKQLNAGFDNVPIYCNLEDRPGPSDFIPTKLGLGRYNDRFGIEVGIAKKINEANLNKPIYLIKYAIGGSNLFNMWNSRLGKANLYTNFIQTVNEGLSLLEGRDLLPSIKSFVWIQGDSDADSVHSKIYEENEFNLISDFKSEFSNYLSPDFVWANVGIIEDEERPCAEQVNEAKIKNVAKQENAFYLATSGIYSNTLEPESAVDVWHYDSVAMLKLGEDVATELLERCIEGK